MQISFDDSGMYAQGKVYSLPPELAARLAKLKLNCTKAKFSLTNSINKDRMNIGNPRCDTCTAFLAGIDPDVDIFRTAENGKVYKLNTETGETSGLGPVIDGANAVEAGRIKSYENGKKSKLGAKKVKKYTDRLVGQKTSTGTEITEIRGHVFTRIAERGVSEKRFEDMMAKPPKQDKTFASRDVCSDRGSGLVVDRETGEMITVMWGRGFK